MGFLFKLDFDLAERSLDDAKAMAIDSHACILYMSASVRYIIFPDGEVRPFTTAQEVIRACEILELARLATIAESPKTEAIVEHYLDTQK